MAPINKPLIVIVGETASGKSSLAMALASKFNGEIICADSRTVYTSMDIGTAKPSPHDQNYIRHHLLDIVHPDQDFTAADFQKMAFVAIDDIYARGKVPIMVGGTGLYIDAVLYDFGFKQHVDKNVRSELDKLSVEQLQAKLLAMGIELPNNPKNPRHLIRAIESNGSLPKRATLRPNTLVIGIEIDRSVLQKRVESRVDNMMQSGLSDEAERLFKLYGKDCRALQTIGYQEFLSFGQQSDVAKEIVLHTMQYAKRQRTWFRRNKSIHWVKKQIQIIDLVTTFLNKNT